MHTVTLTAHTSKLQQQPKPTAVLRGQPSIMLGFMQLMPTAVDARRSLFFSSLACACT